MTWTVPADPADSHGALKTVVVKCLPHCYDHGHEHPDAHVRPVWRRPVSGTTPSTRSRPGESLAKQWCVSSSPMSERVCGSGRILVPMRYRIVAHTDHPMRAVTAFQCKAAKTSLGKGTDALGDAGEHHHSHGLSRGIRYLLQPPYRYEPPIFVAGPIHAMTQFSQASRPLDSRFSASVCLPKGWF